MFDRELCNYRRNERRGVYERSRQKKYRLLKHTSKYLLAKSKKKIASKPLRDIPYPIWIRFRMFFKGIFIKAFCKIGLHSWVLSPGEMGSPKYACFNCEKPSKKIWETSVFGSKAK